MRLVFLYFLNFRTNRCRNIFVAFLVSLFIESTTYVVCSEPSTIRMADPGVMQGAQSNINGWQLAKMKKSIPDMSLS